jgi:hypothetical protein
MATLLVIVALFADTREASEPLVVQLEITPTEAHLGDVLFLRISFKNRGERPLAAPISCLLENGTLRLRLYDAEERISYHFMPDGGPMGPGLREALLEPGTTRVVALRALPLPRLDQLESRFWNPRHWRVDKTWAEKRYLIAGCGSFSATSRGIWIGRRGEHEMATLREFYNGGLHSPVPPGWDWDRPGLGLFGATSFPLVGSLPEELAAIEPELSAGSLRDAVHGTRLTARLYDAKTLDGRREAADELVKWLDAQHEIARHWIAMQLVSWAWGNRGLGEYGFELVDQLIPRGPDEYEGRNWQDQYRKENDSLRQSYLEYLQRPQTPPESPGVKHGAGERRDGPPVFSDAPVTLTPSGARLLGNIRAAGGWFWLPGPASRPWQPRPNVPSYGVRLPGRAATREVVAALGELGTVEYLEINGPDAPDDALAGLPVLRDLRNLSLRDTRISDAALQHLRELPELERVELGHTDNQGTGIQGDGLKHLQTLPKLQYLFLTKTDVDDAAMAHVSSMTGLVGLGVAFTKITDGGMEHLQRLTNLRLLVLSHTKITDEGLKRLDGLKQLKRLDVRGTRVTPEGVARLRRALPDLQIVGTP